MKTQMVSMLSGIALAMSLGSVQATESVQTTDETNVATQTEVLPPEMLSILEEINQEEIVLMEAEEMEVSTGERMFRRYCCGFCYRY